MKTTEASSSTRWKVGLFTVFGILLIGAVTVYVNRKPYWWRTCQLVHINVDDATGLKSKSPVRSLGLEIGYLKTVDLYETHVSLGICITAPVEVLPSTRAYIRSEGFLGDKFVELKPVKYLGPREAPEPTQSKSNSSSELTALFERQAFADEKPSEREPAVAVPAAAPSAAPAEPAQALDTDAPQHQGREIPVGRENEDVQHLVNRVDNLVNQMSSLTTNLKQAINPEELRQTMKELNRTLEAASKTLSPEGGLNQTAQRTLAKLEDGIEQLRDMLTRVNQGEGSVGMLINDPSYADQVREALANLNRLLSRVAGVRFIVDVGGQWIDGYGGGRGWFKLGIWPSRDRYYLIGVAVDPRGRITQNTTTTTVSGLQPVVTQTESVEQTGILLTGMIGKVFYQRLDLSIGALYGDGAVSVALRLGPHDMEDVFEIRDDVYSRGAGTGVDNRATATLKLFSAIYAQVGMESIHPVNGSMPYFIGGGISFDDENIKVLFALR